VLDIEGVLDSLGIDVARVEGKESWALCPMHYQRTGKMDHRPSWSINVESTAHHCFSCGYGGNIVTLHRDLTGSVPDDHAGLAAGGAESDLHPGRAAEPAGGRGRWSAVDPLPVRRPARAVARHRHLQRSSVDRYGVRWDPVGKCWVIPMRSVEGV
jgi:hypothetical protein